MHEAWYWFLDFLGVNNGDNSFSTHMYNFWSGFGGNVSILALIGTLIALYKRSAKKLQKFQTLNPLNLVHTFENSIENRHENTNKDQSSNSHKTPNK